MRIVSTSYSKTEDFDNPAEWLKRISFYSGILRELGRQHEVTGIERINYEGTHEQDGVCYHFIKLNKTVVRFPFKMHRLIKDLRPDVVLINGLIFPMQVIQLHFAVGRKAKIIVLHRAERPFTGIKKYLQKLADRYIHAYLFTSFDFSPLWKNNIDTRKIFEVIQASSGFEPINKPDAKRMTGVTGEPVFLWVGRLDENKDPLTVIHSFLQYLDTQPLAKLYMIFQEDKLLPQIKSIVNAGKWKVGSIILIGKIANQQMQSWYSSADFIISGSHYEGSGVAVTEAMSCGCIPIVTDIPSFRNMMGRGKCGFLYKPGDQGQLLKLLMETKEIDLEAEKARVLAQFKNELSFEAVAEKIDRIIKLQKKI